MSRSPIVFYDIAQAPPVEKTCCSPNPWKTRLALNFKAVPYTTTWVALPDIAQVRTGLHIPACRKFQDGTDFFTLPIIQDPATSALLGDSFDIAIYLQQTYPDAGAGDLFPPHPTALDFAPPAQADAIMVPLSACRGGPEFAAYARFNARVDAVFSLHVQLTVQEFPLDPATAEATKAEFVRRAAGAGVRSWDDFTLAGEARESTLASFRDALGGLAALLLRDTAGPFLFGARPSYADMIVGAWLRMMCVTLPKGEWRDLRGWHEGAFGRLHDALEVYAEVKK
ncbi:hypothetical protein B0H67DRAFT_599168 [Lasiosphaeris hirsuta]|uniref:GST N-terminal domain-containing protein n=1 Tax=Lasiosphaeris hirsuta TaxID=260670 RepID=A0AA40AP71_9PEZI|nr:hypothetical protein B0H67DRAFT_599168 [Lasiosphaeris hirsuta]